MYMMYLMNIKKMIQIPERYVLLISKEVCPYRFVDLGWAVGWEGRGIGRTGKFIALCSQVCVMFVCQMGSVHDQPDTDSIHCDP